MPKNTHTSPAEKARAHRNSSVNHATRQQARRRMAITGETYPAAYQALSATPTLPALLSLQRWVHVDAAGFDVTNPQVRWLDSHNRPLTVIAHSEVLSIHPGQCGEAGGFPIGRGDSLLLVEAGDRPSTWRAVSVDHPHLLRLDVPTVLPPAAHRDTHPGTDGDGPVGVQGTADWSVSDSRTPGFVELAKDTTPVRFRGDDATNEQPSLTAADLVGDPLPTRAIFPGSGTSQFMEWMRAAAAGRFHVGVDAVGWPVWVDVAGSDPHVLVGGNAGSGKSRMLGLVLFGALWLPDVYKVVVVDDRRGEWVWTAGNPNVVAYASTVSDRSERDVYQAVKIAHDAMVERQQMLDACRCGNLGELRQRIRDGRVAGMRLDQVPERMIVAVENITAVLDQVGEMVDDTRRMLNDIGAFGRSVEVTMIATDHKPTLRGLGSQLRDAFGHRYAFGALDPYTAMQVMQDRRYIELVPEGSPVGRGAHSDPRTGELTVFQALDLPAGDEGPVRGMRSLLADRMRGLGYTAGLTIEDASAAPCVVWSRPDGGADAD